MRPELLLERRSEHARLDAGGARRTVDLEHAVEAREVERDGAAVAVADVGLDAADDARPATVWDDRRAGRRGPVEQRPDVVLDAREGDEVRGVRELAAQRAHDVPERLAVGVSGAVVGRVGNERGERRGRLQARRREPELLEPRRCRDLGHRDVEPRGEEPRDRLLLLGRRSLALPAPTPEPASPRRRHAS